MLAMIRDVGVEYWDGYQLGTCKRIEHNVDTGIGIHFIARTSFGSRDMKSRWN